MKSKLNKIIAIFVVTAVMITTIIGCKHSSENSDFVKRQGESDLQYVQSKGTLIVGITDFAPMDYKEGGDWKGFDAELVKAFAESIGVTVEFKEIDWNDKTKLLNNGEIDCIWNGMTMTDELKEIISCSIPYLSNAQVIVMSDDKNNQYDTAKSCQHLMFVVEEGSTGEMLLKDLKYRYNTVSTQKEALQMVLDNKADAAVIDIIMAAFHTSQGQEFDSLGFSIKLNDEKICAGFRKDSDITKKTNDFLNSLYEDGSLMELATQYGIGDAVIGGE